MCWDPAKCWGCSNEERHVSHTVCWWDCRLVQPLWKPGWRFFKKLKIDIPFNLAIALLGIYPKKTETIIHKDLCTPIFMAAQFTIANIWKQPKCPSTDDWIKKLWFIYTAEYYSAIQKNEILPFATT